MGAATVLVYTVAVVQVTRHSQFTVEIHLLLEVHIYDLLVDSN